MTKAARYDDTVAVHKDLCGVIMGYRLGVYPLYINCGIIDYTAVTESFGYGKICVVKLHIFSNKSDSYIFVCILCAAHHLGPLCQVGSAVRKSKMTAYGMCQSFIFQPKGNFIQRRCCKILDNVLLADIALQTYHRGGASLCGIR